MSEMAWEELGYEETKEAFDKAIWALQNDYMYMGQGKRCLLFKHIETREYIKIPKCGVAFNETV